MIQYNTLMACLWSRAAPARHRLHARRSDRRNEGFRPCEWAWAYLRLPDLAVLGAPARSA